MKKKKNLKIHARRNKDHESSRRNVHKPNQYQSIFKLRKINYSPKIGRGCP